MKRTKIEGRILRLVESKFSFFIAVVVDLEKGLFVEGVVIISKVEDKGSGWEFQVDESDNSHDFDLEYMLSVDNVVERKFEFPELGRMQNHIDFVGSKALDSDWLMAVLS